MAKLKANRKGKKVHQVGDWRRPEGKRRPGVFDAVIAALKDSFTRRSGRPWELVAMNIPVHRPDGKPRERALRKEAARALLNMLCGLVYSCDIRTGFIGRPREAGGPWHRFTMLDLSKKAFGALNPGEIHPRRGERAMRAGAELGLLFLSKQPIDYDEATGALAFHPSVRWLNLRLLCQICNLTWMLERDRSYAFRRHGGLKPRNVEAEKLNTKAPNDQAPGLPLFPWERPKHERPESTAGPPRRSGSVANAADVAAAALKRSG